jgi:predicted esterase
MRLRALFFLLVTWMEASAVAAADLPTVDQVFTASTHPMRYVISLPSQWEPGRQWPVIIAPNAHYGSKAATIRMLAPLNEQRKAGFIIVSPIVINSDPVAPMKEYQGVIADGIRAADAKKGEGERDDDARAAFDSAGIRAVIQDVQRLYGGEDRVYITGFSASTHIVYLFLFTHPELLKGAFINSGVYRGRGVDESNLPLVDSPERARVEIQFIAGEQDKGAKIYAENWAETKALLRGCGHPEFRFHEEIVRQGNSEHLPVGHMWFPTRIMDFFIRIQQSKER